MDAFTQSGDGRDGIGFLSVDALALDVKQN